MSDWTLSVIIWGLWCLLATVTICFNIDCVIHWWKHRDKRREVR